MGYCHFAHCIAISSLLLAELKRIASNVVCLELEIVALRVAISCFLVGRFVLVFVIYSRCSLPLRRGSLVGFVGASVGRIGLGRQDWVLARHESHGILVVGHRSWRFPRNDQLRVHLPQGLQICVEQIVDFKTPKLIESKVMPGLHMRLISRYHFSKEVL